MILIFTTAEVYRANAIPNRAKEVDHQSIEESANPTSIIPLPGNF